jgi:predicted pyridoxine 5'-phosphate oxidase superfamily flavin-nucleotide-binding protein
MGKQYQQLSARYIEFIRQQKMFFVGTAAATGKVNISPKGK